MALIVNYYTDFGILLGDIKSKSVYLHICTNTNFSETKINYQNASRQRGTKRRNCFVKNKK